MSQSKPGWHGHPSERQGRAGTRLSVCFMPEDDQLPIEPSDSTIWLIALYQSWIVRGLTPIRFWRGGFL